MDSVLSWVHRGKPDMRWCAKGPAGADEPLSPSCHFGYTSPRRGEVGRDSGFAWLRVTHDFTVSVCATGFASALRPELLGHWQSQWHTKIGF
jgi:hypothetical protein